MNQWNSGSEKQKLGLEEESTRNGGEKRIGSGVRESADTKTGDISRYCLFSSLLITFSSLFVYYLYNIYIKKK